MPKNLIMKTLYKLILVFLFLSRWYFINNDGTVNNKDLTRLFQYLSYWDVEVDGMTLDINGDGKVNNKDIIRLFQYLSNWDVEMY